MRLVPLLAVAAIGCGRFGFDEVSTTSDGAVDAFEPVAGPWAQVFVRGSSTCALKEDGTAWCQGANAEQQLGVGPQTFAVPAGKLPGTWRTLAVGHVASCGIGLDGTLWCWGNDVYGGVPDGDATGVVNTPLQIGSDTDWGELALGDRHGCARKQNNTLWCWGDNGSNQFDPSVPAYTVPTQVRANVRSVSAARIHTSVVDTDGTLWISGKTFDGEGGNGTYGAAFVTWTRIGADADWSTVATGDNRTCAAKTSGSMWCTGAGIFGALGNDTEFSSPTFEQVASGSTWTDAVVGLDHVCARQSDNTAWCWGASTRGQFGDLVRSRTPKLITEVRSIAVGDTHTCLVTPTGVLRCAGGNHAGQVKSPPATVGRPRATGGPFSKLTTYDSSTCAIDGNDVASCWGANNAGNVVPEDVAWRQQPTALPGTGWSLVAVGNSISLGIQGGVGTLHWWGSEYAGDTFAGAITPLLTGFNDFVHAAAGDQHACAVRLNGELYCWGKNDSGQLGVGDTTGRTTPTLVGTGFTQVAAGKEHTCGIQSGTLVCWGDNQFGSVGDGTSVDRTAPTAVSCGGCGGKTPMRIVLGHYFALALMSDGTLFGWGAGEWGQLTNGTSGSSVGIAVATSQLWYEIDAGDTHVCGIDATGHLWCWGHGDEGQLGDGSLDSAAPELRAVGTDTDWQVLALGQHHSCALKASAMRYCWGANHSGVYGDGLSWYTSFAAIALDQ